jgi:hypothetical protein
MQTTPIAVALFLFLSFCVAAPAHADTITLASVGTAADSGQTNSSGVTVPISQNSAWSNPLAGSSWISYASTGDTSAPGYIQVTNGTVVNFFDTFNLAGTATSGTLAVMADDSASVLLNGVVLVAETTLNNTYAVCSDFGVGCLQPTILDLPVSLLHSGANTLEFEVAQHNGSSFGLDYLGSIVDPVSTPEPSSAASLGLGLALLAMCGLFRKSSRLSLPTL